MGVTPNMAVIPNFEAAEGRFLSETENDRHMNVAFIGNDHQGRSSFRRASPIGQTITLEGLPFEVVGVAKAKGSVFGQSQDNFVVIPIETLLQDLGRAQRHGLRRHRAGSRSPGAGAGRGAHAAARVPPPAARRTTTRFPC